MTGLPPADFDADRFRRLLAVVGPETAPDLLHQLAEDLSSCATGIRRGSETDDWTALREASHVLISLSGSAGAMALHGLAQALNKAAHARDRWMLERIEPALMRDLEALIALVRATPTGGA